MRYVLDTNVLVHHVRSDATMSYLEDTYNPFGAENMAIISIATVAEILALAKQFGWGRSKNETIQDLFNGAIITEIRSTDLIEAYVEIDSFSHDVHDKYDLDTSHRNMGKNDIWIAATAMVTDSILLTSDADFNHLNGKFLQVIQYQEAF
ncbi:MAG: PIN domain-containing protein [Bacteroidota bacterium]